MRGLVLSVLAVPALQLLAPPVAAQSNADPGIDVELGILGDFDRLGRTGTYPNGVVAAALSSTVCNKGDEVPWFAAMDPDHPFIAFLAVRESGGRLVQISDRSYVKHAFFALTSSQCTPCTPPGGAPGTFLGQGCSDTYTVGTNGDDFWLGPPEEIDPWTGEWDPVCSHFDRGEPPVAPAQQCDGLRSLTQAQVSAFGPLGHRVQIADAELDVSGASFWYQAQYVVATEPEAVRGDDLGSRGFTPSWTGSQWVFFEDFDDVQHGSVLGRWSGAKVGSATNAGDDGRVYVGVKVTGPDEGLYHYEYAFHNRDNSRGVDEVRIPLCAGARVLDAGFRDVDASATNDWTSSLESGGTELVFRDAGGGNALEWNTIYNVWFDSDAGPAGAGVTLGQARAGGGASSFVVGSQAPLQLFNAFTGAGCSLGSPPSLYATGTPPRATLGNTSFAVESAGNAPMAFHALAASSSTAPGALSIGPCTLWLDGALGVEIYGLSTVSADADGVAVHPLPVPNSLGLEGFDLRLQGIVLNPGGGPLFDFWELTDGLLVRVGDDVPDCP